MKYVCDVCGWVYDEAEGAPDLDIAPGTKFEDLPDDFVCPLCGVGKDDFSEETILRWLKSFYRRFFTQQFKRSCQPDGVRIGSVALGGKDFYRMASDASYSLWMEETEKL